MRARSNLGTQIAGLRQAVQVVEQLALPPGSRQALDQANRVLDNVARRRQLSAEHTVVALAGSTGSGKSSLMNALADAEVAVTGARRPTTAHPLAAIWSTPQLPGTSARPLLDWLEVAHRQEIPADGHRHDLGGLILLDLPDIDSVNSEHRQRAERLAGAVDVLVWVLDPQKYADAVVHSEFLRPMARRAEVTVVVLNQIDRLAPEDEQAVVADLRQRLADDGLAQASVMTSSATLGTGVEHLREKLSGFVRQRRAADVRMCADIAAVAELLGSLIRPETATDLPRAAEDDLLRALESALGVEQIADAVAVSVRGRARAKTGWPMIRWLGRFRPDPLKRLHLQQPAAPEAPVLTPSSPPAPSLVAQAQVETAVRGLADQAANGSVEPWRSFLRSGADAEGLTDALDQALVRTTLQRPDPRWFTLVGALQWLIFAAFVAGALWLAVYAVLGYLQIDTGPVPVIGPVPADPPLPPLPAIAWPTALLVGGAVAGILVALTSGLLARATAFTRRRRARVALRRSVALIAQEHILGKLRRRLEVAATYRAALEQAGASKIGGR